ncbi:MAG: energy transducer TonB [Gammaproteobacteria bacterium]|nr:energy transducer TonB [Gammaproteobacteria bacterium]NND39027.1 energy transducer TonB [Pseudomonadales bacterium]NNL10734.1 energy transducer TonB [Pseudomonadales bacterium]RZV55096.1 MAG: energy transducer TonB [Pseudomonadales bacterium]
MRYIPGQNYQIRYSMAAALLLHGLAIFGLTVAVISGVVQLNQSEVTVSLSKSEQAPEDAEFLAKTNQEGSGSSEKTEEITVTREALFADSVIREVKPLVMPEENSGQPRPIELRIITTTGDSQLSVPLLEPLPEEIEDDGEKKTEQRTLADLSFEIASLEARLAEKQQPDSKKPRVLILTSASTLAADNAEYVHQWRDRVEAVGNLHYPEEARKRELYGDVRLLVKLSASGIVEEIQIMSSSGSEVLDRAAIESIRLASPFEPFPKALADKYDRIDVIRTWQFRKNRVSSKS